jgi:hypothetical protein
LGVQNKAEQWHVNEKFVSVKADAVYYRGLLTAVLYDTLLNDKTVLLTETKVRGVAVIEALPYKPAGRGIDSRWCHWNFLLT